ncbi:aspartic proteinase CDR1-like [Silene latifolia]|uniref:aspartic proteinase CDR1-like n=1 Tax=Silene latifolia TaxID=37657 RepID=UPI003D76B5C4
MSKIDRIRTSRLTGDTQSNVKYARGEYYMELAFGSPPVLQMGLIDTGSDLIWTQCQPCTQCFKQILPIFDPNKSWSYMDQSCDTQGCLDLSGSQHTCTRDNKCFYTYQYADNSYTAGYLATDIITFPQGKRVPKITFGCSINSDGILYAKESTGVIGLGGGPLSLISQLGSRIGGKFSYCFIPFSKEGRYTSTINFGDEGEVSGPGVISTPITKDDQTFYYLTLNGISVGNTKIPLNNEFPNLFNTGNILIDSGATMTILPTSMYNSLISALDNNIHAPKIKDPTNLLTVCYRTTNGGVDLGIPDVTAHFNGGDVVLKPVNTFVEVTRGVMCLAIISADGPVGPTLGNVAQMNFLVGYDIEAGKVFFKPMDCTAPQN